MKKITPKMLPVREVAERLGIGVPTVTHHCRFRWSELGVQKVGRDWFIPESLLSLPVATERIVGRPKKTEVSE